MTSTAVIDCQRSEKADVIECRTLFDALAAAFVNPEVGKSMSSRRAKRKVKEGLHGPARRFQSFPESGGVEEEESSMSNVGDDSF